jgi:cytochrome c-type biogenesis protein CcmH/NrfG
VAAIYPASDPDLYIMLATGRYVAQTGQVPTVDLWSHTAYGQPWQMHEWLSSLLFYGLFLLWGIGGIVLFKALALALAFYLGLQIMRLRGVSPFIALLTSTLALLLLNHAFAERIQIISFVFLILSIYLLELFRSGRIKKWIFLASSAGMFAVWANLHLGYIIGLGLYGLTLIDGLHSGIKNKEWGLLKWSAAAFLLALLATGITPYGFGLSTDFLKLFTDTATKEFDIFIWKSVLEYQPLLSPGFSREPFVIYGLIWLAFSALGLLFNLKKARLSEWLLYLVFVYQTYWVTRYLWFLVWLSFPFTAVNWQGAGGYLISKLKIQSSKFKVSGNVIFAVLILLVLIGAALFQRGGQHLWQRMGLGWESQVNSDGGADFLKRNLRDSRVFNDFDIGGYLLWQRIPVFVDGRISPYQNTRVLEDHFRIFGGDLALLDKYSIDWVFIPYSTSSGTARFVNFNQLLAGSGNWALVYWDDACLIYVRRIPKFADVASAREYRHLNPAAQDMSVPPGVFAAELEAKFRENPEQTAPHLLASNYWFAQNNMEKALKHLLEVIAKKPKDATLFNNLGNIHLRSGRMEEAIRAYKKAVTLDVNMGLAYCNWGYVLETRGETAEAVRLYTIATRVAPGDAWPYNRMGIIAANRGNMNQAIKYWRKGAAIDPAGDAARNLKKASGRF